MNKTILLIALIAGFGYCIQTISGFGAMVVAITLGAHLLEIRELLLLLLPLSVLQCGYITLRHRAAIDWRLLGRWIVPAMGAGTALGAALAGLLGSDQLRTLLAAIILILSLIELRRLSKSTTPSPPLAAPLTAIGIFGAGLMHGIYATGGPLLVYTIGRRVPDKAVFRSTLTIVWLVLNSALIGFFVVDGRYSINHFVHIAYLIPLVILGVFIGEHLHTALDGKRFRQFTLTLLAVAAITLLIR